MGESASIKNICSKSVQKFIDCTYFLCLCFDICLIIAFRVTSFSNGHSMSILLSPLGYLAINSMVSGVGSDIPACFDYFLM